MTRRLNRTEELGLDDIVRTLLLLELLSGKQSPPFLDDDLSCGKGKQVTDCGDAVRSNVRRRLPEVLEDSLFLESIVEAQIWSLSCWCSRCPRLRDAMN